MSESEQDQDELHELRFYVRRNIRYHLRRFAFFTKWSRLTAFLGVLFGSAAAATLMAKAPAEVTAVFAVLVTIASAIDLIVGTSQRAALHNDLRRCYLEIEEELDTAGWLDAEPRRKLWAKIRRIEGDEPPALPVLELMARNDVICAMFDGDERSEHFIPIPGHMRATAHWINWDTSDLRPSPNPTCQVEASPA
ncbi:hypothetical protein [Pseudomonas boanensis]|uniref:hypothetical protein n=1 Tax=Metapseudomonas boanensis TaxID=2822138 RepID=UPI0035D4F6A0